MADLTPALKRPEPGSISSLVRHWIERGLTENQIIEKARQRKFKHHPSTIGNLIDFWKDSHRAAGNLKKSGLQKKLSDIAKPFLISNYKNICIEYDVTFDLKGGGTKTIRARAADFDKNMTKEQMLIELYANEREFMEQHYDLRSKGRSTTGPGYMEINITSLVGC